MAETDEDEDSDPSGRRAIPSFPMDEEETQIHRFEWPRTSRTSLEPVTLLRPARTSTTPATTISELSSTSATKGAPDMSTSNESNVVPTEPPPPPPKKVDPWYRRIKWAYPFGWLALGLAVAFGIAYVAVRLLT